MCVLARLRKNVRRATPTKRDMSPQEAVIIITHGFFKPFVIVTKPNAMHHPKSAF